MSFSSQGVVRKHRTALFIDGPSYDAGGAYQERTERLLQSVNGSNIKVDVFRVSGSSITPWGASASVDDGVGDKAEALKAWASDLGYDQALVSIAP